jgi:hypothetical protein
MANHSVHRSLESGNFVVADKEGHILHTFPTEGEANLQVLALDEKEKAQAKEAKEAKVKEANEAKAEKAEAKQPDDERPPARHR